MADEGFAAELALARRYLHWAVFLVAVMAAILVIDLQLKKAVARQAVEASVLLSEARYGHGAPLAPDDPGAGDDGAGGVGGDAGLAAGARAGGGPGEDAAAGGVGGAAGGAPGDDA